MKIFKWLFFIALSFFTTGFTLFETADPSSWLKKNVPQDLLVYANSATLDKPLITSEVQQKFYQDYLKIYFSPWNHETLLYTNDEVYKLQKERADKFKFHPGIGKNQQPHTASWIDAVIKNMHLSTFPNTSQLAITTRIVHLRALPTDEPIFESWDKPGEGYPFDKLGDSLLPPNLPIKVIQISKDHAWALVLTPYKLIGWMSVNDYAEVDKNFIQRWQTSHYVVAVKDKTSVMDEQQQFLFFTRIGEIYPLVEENGKGYRILVVVEGAKHKAILQTALLPKGVATMLPLPLTTRNVSRIANLMLGQPYDWGGAYGDRDCSSTLMNLFASFGIWLPRNSSNQSRRGTFISLTHLKDVAAKEAFIKKHAVPFATILWVPGHVVLYLGQRGERQYVYQTMWGLHTKHWFESEEGRIVVGKTVVTPIDFGKDLPVNVSTFLSYVQGMALIVGTPPSTTSTLTTVSAKYA